MKKYVEFAFVGLISVFATLSSIEMFKPTVIDGGNAFNNVMVVQQNPYRICTQDTLKNGKKTYQLLEQAEEKVLGTKPIPDDEVVGPHQIQISVFWWIRLDYMVWTQNSLLIMVRKR